jgi:hypothetical protein
MENWKDIEGYEGLYQISDDGNVKSLGRETKRVLNQGEIICKTKEKILTPRKTGNNLRNSRYLSVVLYDKERKSKSFLIHRLVAHHFIKSITNDLVVNHKDFNGNNNNISNLELITQKENTIHYHSNENPLYNKEMLIDLHHNQKLSLRAIARMFGKHHGSIKRIIQYYNIEIKQYCINQYG